MLRLYAKPELKKIRESVCSQEEMMKLLQIQLGRPFPRSTYAHKENGDYTVSSDEAIAISRILKVEIDQIFMQKEGNEQVEPEAAAEEETPTETIEEGESNA